MKKLNKMPPFDVELERTVLYCILFSEECQSKINVLNEEDFYNLDNKEIFKVFKEYLTSGKILDPALLPDKLKKSSSLLHIVNIWGLTSRFDEYVKKLKWYTNRRSLEYIARDVYTKVEEERDPLEIRNYLEKKIDEIKDIKRLSKNNDEVYFDFEEKILNQDDFSGIGSGFQKLDKMIRGFCPGTLNIIGGTPGVGKTTFILNIVNYICSNLKKRVLYVSLEMDYILLQAKLISIISSIPVYRMLSTKKNLSDGEVRKIIDANAQMDEYKLFRMGEDKTTIVDIENEIRILGGVDIVFVDYLQLLSPVGNRKSRYEEISILSRDLKKLATKFKIPVIAVASINRSYASRLDKKPTISDLRDSGNIEYDADIILFLYRESSLRSADENEDRENFEHSAELIIAKNRYGFCNKIIDLYWDGDKSRFYEAYQARLEGV